MFSRESIYKFFKKNLSTNYYYYQSSFNLWNMLLWNIIFPGRLLSRLKGKTLFKKKFNQDLYENINLKKNREIYEELSENGCVVIDKYFSVELIDEFKREYNKEIENIKKNTNQHCCSIIPIKKCLIDLWLDMNLMNIITNMSSQNLVARNYPTIAYSTNFEDQKNTKQKVELFKNQRSKFADDWHIDHSNLFNVHILLEDVDKEDLCMQYLAKTHKKLNQTMLFSDEEIERSGGEIKNCYGKKGTVYIHYGNTVHRMRAKKNSSRLQLHLEFTSLTNVLLNSENIAKCLSDNFKLNELTEAQKKICRSIFPEMSALKGYDFKNGEYKLSKKSVI